MTKSRSTEQKWFRGALLAIAAAGCQSGALDGAPGGDRGGDLSGDQEGDLGGEPGQRLDLAEALAGLPGATVLLAGDDGAPRFLAGDLGRIELAPATGATGAAASPGADRELRPALPPIQRAFGLTGAELVLRRVTVDEGGARHYRYDQRLGGLDVIGGDLAIHVDAAGAIFGANGAARGEPAPARGAAAISEGAARRAIAADGRWADPGLAITAARRVYLQTAAGAVLEAYEQTVEGARGDEPVLDRVYVDAARGGVLAVHPAIHHALNRRIYNANNGGSLPGTLARTEGQAPTGNTDVDAAYDNLGSTYTAFWMYWLRDPIGAIVASVHYGVNYCNLLQSGNVLAFGDGNPATGCASPARAVDLTAHELAHGITAQDSGLIYSGEPGGLNESYSDLFGAFVEAFADGGGTGPLSTAADVFLMGDTVLAPFIRSLCDPAADGASADLWTSSLGSIDVHYSSGPNNLVFCLLTKGGPHPRGRTSVTVPAIGMDKALRIFYKAQRDILTATSNYAAMRTAAIMAAQQLGYDQATQDAVACGYAAIAVGTAPASCGGAPTTDGVLASGVPVTGLSDGTVGTMRFFSLAVPAGAPTLTFTVGGGTGNVDLYVNYGTKPSAAVFQCRPALTGNNETCTFAPPSAGTYHVGLRTSGAYSGVTLVGSYDPYLASAVPVTVAGASGSEAYYRLSVPSGKALSIRISGGTGDADLYTRFGGRPTTTTYTCRPYLTGNNETCTATTTAATAGDWYVLVRGYSAFSGVQLVGSF